MSLELETAANLIVAAGRELGKQTKLAYLGMTAKQDLDTFDVLSEYVSSNLSRSDLNGAILFKAAAMDAFAQSNSISLDVQRKVDAALSTAWRDYVTTDAESAAELADERMNQRRVS